MGYYLERARPPRPRLIRRAYALAMTLCPQAGDS